MIKENYDAEVINKKNFILAIFFFFYSIFFSVACFLENVLVGAISFFVIALIEVIFLFIAYFRKRKFIEKRNLIIKKGIKIDGTIIGKRTFTDESRDSDGFLHSYTNTYLIIEYFCDGKKNNYTTPAITFSYSLLTDKTVDVYIYGNEIYVDNYKLREHKNKRIIPLK